jgi:hypothetical protein
MQTAAPGRPPADQPGWARPLLLVIAAVSAWSYAWRAFTGTIPEPTLATLRDLIRTGFVATFLQSPTTTDPRLTWIAGHCLNVTPRASDQHTVLPLAVYVCLANT